MKFFRGTKWNVFSLVEPQTENQLVSMPCCGISLGFGTILENIRRGSFQSLFRENRNIAFWPIYMQSIKFTCLETNSETNQIINREFTQNKVLPSGIGHTTSCFLSVEGSNKPAPYIVTEEGETMEIEKVQQLGRFSKICSKMIGRSDSDHQSLNSIERFILKTLLSKRFEPKSTTTQEWFQNEFIFRFAWAAIFRIERAPHLKIIKSESSLVRVLWPQVRCRLLNAEVQILDSPGVDVTPDLDLWIDKYCLNADVFVLVGGFLNPSLWLINQSENGI